jgi:hypothetical protein
MNVMARLIMDVERLSGLISIKTVISMMSAKKYLWNLQH